MESEILPLPNMALIGRLLLTEDMEFRLLNFGGVLPIPLLGVGGGAEDVELVVVEESPDLVLTASRLLGDEDLDTAGELHERRAKLTSDSETERAGPETEASFIMACCGVSISAIVGGDCLNAVIVIRGVSVTSSGVTLICSELRLLQSSLAGSDGVTWLSLLL